MNQLELGEDLIYGKILKMIDEEPAMDEDRYMWLMASNIVALKGGKTVSNEESVQLTKRLGVRMVQALKLDGKQVSLVAGTYDQNYYLSRFLDSGEKEENEESHSVVRAFYDDPRRSLSLRDHSNIVQLKADFKRDLGVLKTKVWTEFYNIFSAPQFNTR